MIIHKEGYKIILIIFILLVIFNTALLLLISRKNIIPFISIGLSTIFWCLIIWFFRVPDRNYSYGLDKIIAPADGKIVVIEETLENEYFNDKRIQISIFMSPLNVHVNRYPVNGKVTYTKYHPGDYLVAWHPKSSTLNERSSIVIKHEKYGEILVRQIAGAVARRIITYSEKDQFVNQCDELGFIRFGSRVDVFLPLSADIDVRMNQKSVGGKTVLASF